MSGERCQEELWLEVGTWVRGSSSEQFRGIASGQLFEKGQQVSVILTSLAIPARVNPFGKGFIKPALAHFRKRKKEQTGVRMMRRLKDGAF